MTCTICGSALCGPACVGRPGYVWTESGWARYADAVLMESEDVRVDWNVIWSYGLFGLEPDRNRLVALDTETSGLKVEDGHELLEIAWAEVGPGKALLLNTARIPHTLHVADPFALEINRYEQRHLGDPEQWAPKRHNLPDILTAAFEGATIVGSNTAHDKRFVTKWLAEHFYYEPAWHHQPLEVGSYVAGAFGIPYTMSFRDARSQVAGRLGIDLPEQDHTAGGDVRAINALLQALWRRG